MSSFLFESERWVLRVPTGGGKVTCFLLYRGKMGLQRAGQAGQDPGKPPYF